MNFDKYCEALFNKQKEHIFYLSDEEIKLLETITDKDEINFDYEVIDQRLADYMFFKGEKVFGAQDDSSYNYQNYLDEIKIKLGSEYEFVTRTVKSVQSKISAYSMIFSNAIKNSEKNITSVNNRYAAQYDELNKALFGANKALSKSRKNFVNAKNSLRKAQSSLDETHKTIDNMVPNVLTVVSILISIIIAVVIVYITIFLDPDGSRTIQNVLQLQLAKYVLSGHVSGNIIFLLLFMLATLTGRSILTSCSEHQISKDYDPEGKDRYTPESFKRSCRNCQKNCSSRKKFIKRASYIAYFNVAMICGYVALYIWWVIEYYWTMGNGNFKKSPDLYIIVVLFIIIIVSIVSFIRITLSKRANKEDKQKE